MGAACPAHQILPDFVALIILDEKWKLQNSFMYSFLHSSTVFSLLFPNILFILAVVYTPNRNIRDTDNTNELS
jgi:hypothetical protein